MERLTVADCKKYLVTKGWKLIKRCSNLNYYYWDSVDHNTGKHYTSIWTLKEMRYKVERMKMRDWLDAEDEKLRQGVQQSLFLDWEYVS